MAIKAENYFWRFASSNGKFFLGKGDDLTTGMENMIDNKYNLTLTVSTILNFILVDK